MASDHASEAPPPLSAGATPDVPAGASAHNDEARIAAHKRAAARAAAQLVQDGMKVGLGTGSTVAYLLEALGERAEELRSARCVATSPATAQIARGLGLNVEELDEIGELDIAIDGADQVAPDGWLVKGGGGAHTREKIVAGAAERFVVIVSAEKAVARLRAPVPLELLRFGVERTLAQLGSARLRPGAAASPDGNPIADYFGEVSDPERLAARLNATAGVVEHGIFPGAMVSEILIAGADGVSHRVGGKPSQRPRGEEA